MANSLARSMRMRSPDVKRTQVQGLGDDRGDLSPAPSEKDACQQVRNPLAVRVLITQ